MKLDQKMTAQLARMFDVAFNGALLYGGNHPTTKKSAEPFASVLIPLLEQIRSISIFLDKESLFLEKHCLDTIINCKQIITYFKKTGIISVSFSYGIRLEDIQNFISISCDNNEELTLDIINQRMQETGCSGILLNYVQYRKRTDDQVTAGKEFKQVPSTSEHSVRLIGKKIIKEMENVASLSHLIKHPEKTASILKKRIGNPETESLALNAVTKLRKSITSSSQISRDSLLNAVYRLIDDLSRPIKEQKTTGTILNMSDRITEEVDNLTLDVIVKLVKEDYSKGELSLKQLSRILLRMLSDLKEIKRVLPRIKIELISRGMSLSDYCHMIKLVNEELKSDLLGGPLVEAAEGVGVSFKEIISAIKEQPSDAARLIYLAAEIRQGGHTNDTQLSNFLTYYIEKVSAHLALENTESTGSFGIEILRARLIRLESQLTDKLKKNRIDDKILQEVTKQLSSRFEGVVVRTSEKWLLNVIPEKDRNYNESVKKITSFFGRALSEDCNRDILLKALQNKGFEKKRIDTFFQRLMEHVSAGYSTKLPRNVISSNNLIFLLNREIKQISRYSIPLSTIMITLVKVKIAGEFHKYKNDEVDLLLPQMFRTIKRIIRDIDLMGTLERPFSKSIFIIMSMIDMEGARDMAKRLNLILSEKEFLIGKEKVFLKPAISVTYYIKDETTDIKAYLRLVKKNHKRVVDSLAENIG